MPDPRETEVKVGKVEKLRIVRKPGTFEKLGKVGKVCKVGKIGNV